MLSVYRRLARAVALVAPLVLVPHRASAEPATPVSVGTHRDTYALPNGLQVVLDEDHRAPLVAITVLYRAGRADDPQGRRGLADVIGWVLETAATRHLPRGDARPSLFQALTIHPFQIRAETFTEHAVLTVAVPSHALPLALWIEGDRMGFATDGLSDDQIDRGRRAAIDAQRRRDAVPFAAELAAAESTIFGPLHAYPRTFAAGKPELDGLTVADTRAQMHRLYQAGNATISLAGDFAPATVKPLIAEYFGALPAAAPAAATDPPRADLTAERRSVVTIDGARSTVLLAWPTPALYDDDDLRLDVLAWILEERLGHVLVGGQHAAADVGAHERSLHRASVFTVTVKVAATSTPAEVIKLVDVELARLRDGAPSDAEIASARDSILLRLASQHDAIADRSRALAVLAVGGSGGLARLISAYAHVDGAALQRTTRAFLPADRRVVITGNPRDAAASSRPLSAGR